jgi:hypothetical protein
MFSRAPAGPIQKSGNARLANFKRESAERIKRFGSRAREMAGKNKHRFISIGVGAGLGLLRRFSPETMEKLSFGPVTPELTIGLGALIASYFVKSEILDHLATAGLTLGAYQLASGAGVEGDFGAGEV